jgi:hypothetical protein
MAFELGAFMNEPDGPEEREALNDERYLDNIAQIDMDEAEAYGDYFESFLDKLS